LANWIKFYLSGADKLEADLPNKTSQLTAALTVKTRALLYQLQGKLSAKIRQVMNRGYATGKLASSVAVKEPTGAGGVISGSTGIPQGPTHDYGTIHELGHPGAYRITATAKKALAWQLSTKAKGMAYARFVTHPPIPALRFVSTTREEAREWIAEELQKTVDEVLRKK
jgi:hypothetical protein